MKVAIVHDWLIGGGAERVVAELHKMYPDAPIYTSYATDEWKKKLDGKVVTGWLQHWPLSKLRKYLPPLRILYFTKLKLKDFDLVISSSGAEAKGIKVPNNTLHVNYCHSPTHYYWVRYDEYIKNPGFGMFDWSARIGLKMLIAPLRRWDFKAAQRPDVMIANSTYTQANIKKYYGRESVIIHPPVDIERFRAQSSELRAQISRQGFVTAGRQTPYMRKDLAIAACTKLNLSLKVIGKGPEHDKLVKMAGPTVEFLDNVSDEEMPSLFQQAEAFILPGQEDFGIVGVESLAAGTPIIAYQVGGSLDFLDPGRNGEFFAKQTVDSLFKVLSNFNPDQYTNIPQTAEPFAPKHFQQQLQQLLAKSARVKNSDK